MEIITITALFVFVVHCQLQRARAGWEESSRLRHYFYFNPYRVYLDDANYFVYGESSFIQTSGSYSTDGDAGDVIAPSDIPQYGYHYSFIIRS